VKTSTAYPDVDPKRPTRFANYMVVRDMGGRFLGVFLRHQDMDAWASGLPGTMHRVQLYVGDRIVHRWTMHTLPDGDVCWYSKSMFKGL
jgi:hypothetical protein